MITIDWNRWIDKDDDEKKYNEPGTGEFDASMMQKLVEDIKYKDE